MIDTGIGNDQTGARGHDQDVALGAQHLIGLAQDRLDQAGVLAGDLGQLARPRRWLKARQIKVPALSLGDNFLGHDQHVVSPRRQLLSLDGGDQQCGKIGARLDVGNAIQCRNGKLDRAGHLWFSLCLSCHPSVAGSP